MSPPLRPRAIVALSLVTLALLMAAALWTLGLVMPMRPFSLRLLVFGSPVLAAIGWPIGKARSLPLAVRFATGLGALVAVSSSVLFVVAFVFGPPRLLTGGQTRAEAASPERLRLVSYNVLHDYPRLDDPDGKAGDLARVLAHVQPDVVLLQEAWCLAGRPCLAERLGDELEMSWVWSGASGSELIGFEEGCAILSRFPLVGAERWDLEPRARPWRRRSALSATLEVGDSPLQLVCAHLENDSGVATAQARWLAGRVEGLDGVVVGGDLNLDGASDGVRRLREVGLVDLFPDGIDHVLLAEGSGWATDRAEIRLADDEVAGLLGREAPLSDHSARLVDLRRDR